MQLVFDNARLYNPEESVYYKNANQVELDFKALLSAKWHSFLPNLLYLFFVLLLVYIALDLGLIMELVYVLDIGFEKLYLGKRV